MIAVLVSLMMYVEVPVELRKLAETRGSFTVSINDFEKLRLNNGWYSGVYIMGRNEKKIVFISPSVGKQLIQQPAEFPIWPKHTVYINFWRTPFGYAMTKCDAPEKFFLDPFLP